MYVVPKKLPTDWGPCGEFRSPNQMFVFISAQSAHTTGHQVPKLITLKRWWPPLPVCSSFQECHWHSAADAFDTAYKRLDFAFAYSYLYPKRTLKPPGHPLWPIDPKMDHGKHKRCTVGKHSAEIETQGFIHGGNSLFTEGLECFRSLGVCSIQATSRFSRGCEKSLMFYYLMCSGDVATDRSAQG